MQYIILILIFFIMLNAVLKLSFWRWWQAVLFSALTGGFVLAVSPYAAGQSKTELDAWLQNHAVMQNIAVLVTLEAVIVFTFAFMRLRRVLGTPVKRYAMAPLEIYPGLMLFPVLFYLLSHLFFALPGVSFNAIAYSLAAVIFVLLPSAAGAVAAWLPEEDLRLEMQFIVNLFVCIIGLAATVNGETAYTAVEHPLHVKPLLLAFTAFTLLFAGGFLWRKYRKNRLPE